MSGYVQTSSDNGGVHYNSGIPNRAFALTATTLGGHAWETAGRVWYDVLTGPDIQPGCDFATFAALTINAAVARFGEGAEAAAVRSAWASVGVGARAADAPPRGEGIDPNAPLLVRRTGGFAGLVRERRTSLAELPRSDPARLDRAAGRPDAGRAGHGEPAHPGRLLLRGGLPGSGGGRRGRRARPARPRARAAGTHARGLDGRQRPTGGRAPTKERAAPAAATGTSGRARTPFVARGTIVVLGGAGSSLPLPPCPNRAGCVPH